MIVDVLMPPLTPSETTAAYALAGATAGILTGVPVVAVAVLFFGLGVADPLLAVLFAAGSALMLSLTGILVGLWSMKWDHAAAFFSFVLTPMTFLRSEEHTSELQSLMRISYAVFCLKKKKTNTNTTPHPPDPPPPTPPPH